jgi:GntR family transcriptional repressor for pyruvate dehydrogenase complex
MFESVRTNKISEHIVGQIRKAIFDGRLKPGDRLPTEKALMESFSVSKATLREALRVLEVLGFLEIRKGASGGAFVTEVDTKAARDSLLSFLRFTDLSLTDLSEARLLLETHCAEQAASRISEADLDRLGQLVESLDAALKSSSVDFGELGRHIEFHHIIAQATANPILIFFLDFVCELLMGSKELLKPGRDFYERVLAAHERIHSALRERSPKRARGEMIRHIQEEELDLLDLRKARGLDRLDLVGVSESLMHGSWNPREGYGREGASESRSDGVVRRARAGER